MSQICVVPASYSPAADAAATGHIYRVPGMYLGPVAGAGPQDKCPTDDADSGQHNLTLSALQYNFSCSPRISQMELVRNAGSLYSRFS